MALEKQIIFQDIVAILKELMQDWEYDQEITMNTALVSDLEFESIDIVALGETLEGHFQQAVPFATLLTELGEKGAKDFFISDLVDFLALHLEEKNEQPQ